MATPEIYGLSADDVAVLKAMADEYRRRKGPPPRAPEEPEEPPAADTYVALTPAGGIPARSGAAVGSADCDLYQVLREFVGTASPTLIPVGPLSQTVHNLSATAIPGATYVPVCKDKFGTWLAPAWALADSLFRVTGRGANPTQTAVQAVTATGTTSLSFSSPGGTDRTTMLVAVIAAGGADSTPPTAPSGWTRLWQLNSGSSSIFTGPVITSPGLNVWAFCKAVNSTDTWPQVFTAGGVTSEMIGAIYRLDGCGAPECYGTQSGGSPSATRPVYGLANAGASTTISTDVNLVPTEPSSLHLVLLASNQATIPTVTTAGFTSLAGVAGSAISLAAAWKLLPNAQNEGNSFNPALRPFCFATQPSAAWAALALTFRRNAPQHVVVVVVPDRAGNLLPADPATTFSFAFDVGGQALPGGSLVRALPSSSTPSQYEVVAPPGLWLEGVSPGSGDTAVQLKPTNAWEVNLATGLNVVASTDTGRPQLSVKPASDLHAGAVDLVNWQRLGSGDKVLLGGLYATRSLIANASGYGTVGSAASTAVEIGIRSPDWNFSIFEDNVGPLYGFWVGINITAPTTPLGAGVEQFNRSCFLVFQNAGNVILCRQGAGSPATPSYAVRNSSGTVQVGESRPSYPVVGLNFVGGIQTGAGMTGDGTAVGLFNTGTGAPASSGATGVKGTLIATGGFLYICISTNSWVRIATTTF